MNPDLAFIGSASAAGLGAVELVYSGSGRISKLYLLDGVVEAVLVAAWAVAWRRRDK